MPKYIVRSTTTESIEIEAPDEESAAKLVQAGISNNTMEWDQTDWNWEVEEVVNNKCEICGRDPH